MSYWKLILIGFIVFCFSFKSAERPYFKIKEGVGVEGLIEIGKTIKWTKKRMGNGKIIPSYFINCRMTLSYFEFEKYGIKAFTSHNNRIRTLLKLKKPIDHITFDYRFSGELENGLKIGQSTRQQIYDLYGKPNNNFNAYNDLGISFHFVQDSFDKENSNDKLAAIFIFKPEK